MQQHIGQPAGDEPVPRIVLNAFAATINLVRLVRRFRLWIVLNAFAATINPISAEPIAINQTARTALHAGLDHKQLGDQCGA
ncbi:MAG: hypothetical protein OXH78_12425 [Acidimicrobiaceae bacterium]|nr:hypothetical protein [Acidimicrobiaceae bacterium]